MDKLLYQFYKIVSPDFFDELQPEYEKSIVVTPNKVNHIADAYSETYAEILPGVASDGTMAGMLKITFPDIFPAALSVDVNAAVLNTAETIFGQDSTIICFYCQTEHTTIYYLLTLPLKQRLPEVSRFLDRKKKDTLAGTYIETFDDEFEKIFSEFTRNVQKKELSPEEKGYQPALINFIPHKEKKTDYTVMKYISSDDTQQIQTITPHDVINKITNSTIEYFSTTEHNTFKEAQKQMLDKQQFQAAWLGYIKRVYPDTPEKDIPYILNRLDQWAYGMYILDPLVNDDDVSDIMIVRWNDIRVKVKNRRYTSNLAFRNERDYENFIWGLAARNNFFLDQKAIHVFSDTKTNPNFRMRMNLVTGYLTTDETPYYHIRKIAKHKRDFKYLLDNNMLDETLMNYLIDRARYGPGMIFTGKGASGKTTLMNALLDKIPFDKSGLAIQESEELFSDVHPHLMFEKIRINDTDPRQSYRLEHLARNGLLTDLDYFIIGEIKGQEAADFMMAADTGHRCWCSVHAPTAYDAMDKLADYVMSATRYDFNTVNKMLSHLGTVVFMKDFQVCEVLELKGWDAKKQQLVYIPIYMRPGMEHPEFATAV